MLRLTALFALAMVLTLSTAGCKKDTGWTQVPDDHPELVAAREEARETYPEFLQMLRRRDPLAIYTVEVRVEKGGQSEYITLDVARADEEEISGTIVGYPQVIDELSGAPYTAPASALTDWRVDLPDGDFRGGYASEVRARLQRAGG
jgi:hypothetical protein